MYINVYGSKQLYLDILKLTCILTCFYFKLSDLFRIHTNLYEYVLNLFENMLTARHRKEERGGGCSMFTGYGIHVQLLPHNGGGKRAGVLACCCRYSPTTQLSTP